MLIVATNDITCNREIANTLAETFEHNSGISSSTAEFLNYKTEEEEKPIEIKDDTKAPTNQPFTYIELQQALKDTKGKHSPGPDGISCEMKKYFSQETKAYLLKLYNFIWNENIFPIIWREMITIPVLNPIK